MDAVYGHVGSGLASVASLHFFSDVFLHIFGFDLLAQLEGYAESLLELSAKMVARSLGLNSIIFWYKKFLRQPFTPDTLYTNLLLHQEISSQEKF